MSKSVKIVLFSILALLFCLSIDKVDVKASNGSIQTNGNNYNSSLTIPTNSTWNQVMSSAGQNAQPSSACTGYYVAFGYKCADNDICYQTVYFAEPSIYADLSHTQGATYDGVTYNLRYPVAFINWYPTDVALPNGREFINNSYRSCYYPTPTGRMLEGAFIVGAGEDILYLTNYSDGNAQQAIDPLSSTPYSFQYSSLWWDNYIPSTSATTPFIFMQPNRNLWQGVINNSLWCTRADCPVFCDLYEALKYSETGIIDDNNRQYVLYGAESAAVIPTPIPTDTPTPTPTATPIPQITGTVSIDGGTVNIGNFPTPEPTMAPWYPYINPEDIYNPEAPLPEILPSGIEQADYEYILKLYRQSSNYLGINLDDITPTPSGFWSVDDTYLWHSSNGFFPDNVLADFSNPDDENLYDGVGNVLIYPKTAMQNVENSGFMGFMADSLSCFRRSSENTDSVIEPGDNIMTYFMFAFVGIVVMWFFKNIIK